MSTSLGKHVTLSKPDDFGKLLQDDSVYNHTDDLLQETRELIKAVRQNPKKYLTIHLKFF